MADNKALVEWMQAATRGIRTIHGPGFEDIQNKFKAAADALGVKLDDASEPQAIGTQKTPAKKAAPAKKAPAKGDDWNG